MSGFNSEVYCTLEASAPHYKNTKYYVAIGKESWQEDGEPYVIKTQMMYLNEKTGNWCRSGRKAPSYPLGSDDWNRVVEVVDKLVKEYKNGRRGDLSEMIC